MENRKIVITEKELAMAIMRVTAFVSAAVQNHLTGRQEFDPEEYKETKMMFGIAEAFDSGAESVMIIRKKS